MVLAISVGGNAALTFTVLKQGSAASDAHSSRPDPSRVAEQKEAMGWGRAGPPWRQVLLGPR